MGVGVAGHLRTLKVWKIAMVSWNGGFIRFGGRGLSKERETHATQIMSWGGLLGSRAESDCQGGGVLRLGGESFRQNLVYRWIRENDAKCFVGISTIK